MKFLVCPTKCSTGIEVDDSPSGSPSTAPKRQHVPAEDAKEDEEVLILKDEKPEEPVRKSGIPVAEPGSRRSRGFINVFRALGAMAFRRPHQTTRSSQSLSSHQSDFKNKLKLYEVFGETSDRKKIEKSPLPSKIPVNIVQKPQRKNSNGLKNYPGSPRRLSNSPRKFRKEILAGTIPPEKPKRLLAGKSDARKSPILGDAKPPLKSPVAKRASPVKGRKTVAKVDKKTKVVSNETCFLSTIAEEIQSKFILCLFSRKNIFSIEHAPFLFFFLFNEIGCGFLS